MTKADIADLLRRLSCIDRKPKPRPLAASVVAKQVQFVWGEPESDKKV